MTIHVEEHLLLRTYQPYDAQELFACVDKNRAHLREFLPWVNMTLKPEHSLNFIQNMLVRETAQQGIAMGIFLDEMLIGGIGMHEWDHMLRKVQIGYWLAKDAEGKGYMLHSARAFISFLFDRLVLNKIEIHFIPYNTRSSELTKKLGAKVEGVLRDSVLFNGALEDVVVTGILKKEWSSVTKN